MSTTDTRTIAELNAATDAQRTAATRAQVNAGSTGKRTAGSAPRTAGKRAASAPKSTPPRTAGKRSSAPKSAPKSAPAVNSRSVNRAISQVMVDQGAAWFAALPTRTTKRDGKQVKLPASVTKLLGTTDDQWYDWNAARQMVKQVYGYVPQGVWNVKFGARDVGRPASQSSSAA